MRRLAIAVVLVSIGLAAESLGAAQAASTTRITATPATSSFGQPVTFTATFTLAPACSTSVKPHYFTIDTTKYVGSLVISGRNGVETYSTSALGVGKHTVKYYWQTSDAKCIDSTSITYNVGAAQPSPSPSPSPRPSPSPSPSPSGSPVATANPTPGASPSPVVLVATEQAASPLGYVGGALIVLTVVAGLALAVLSRRSA